MMMGTYSSSSSRGDMNEKPAWLESLMAETFFGGCGVHQDRRKNEKNVFCLHCCLSICPHCLSSHRSHPLLQVLLFSSSKPSFSSSSSSFLCRFSIKFSLFTLSYFGTFCLSTFQLFQFRCSWISSLSGFYRNSLFQDRFFVTLFPSSAFSHMHNT